MNDKKNDKPSPNQKKYLIGQYVANLIGVVIITLIMVYLIFGYFGAGVENLKVVQAFMLIFISSFVPIQCHTAIGNTRRDYLAGKWIIDENETSLEPDAIINPWRRIGPLSFIAGIIVAVITCFAVSLLTEESLNQYHVNIIAFIPLFLVTTILISIILPRDQTSFAASLSKPLSTQSESPFRYFLFEHIGLWIPIQALINGGIGFKQFTFEAAKVGGNIPVTTVSTDCGIVTSILIFFMWLSSQGQVRADVRLGRVRRPDENIISKSRFANMNGFLAVILTLIFFNIIATGVGELFAAFFNVTGIVSVSAISATLIKICVAIIATTFGCWAGIWWGTRREAALLQKLI